MTGTRKEQSRSLKSGPCLKLGQVVVEGPILQQSQAPLQLYLRESPAQRKTHMDHRTLQKLGTAKYPVRTGINIPSLDEFSKGKMDCNGKWLAQQTESKQRIHPGCCCKRTQFLNSRDFWQPWPRPGKSHTLKLLNRVCEQNVHSSKDQVTKELVFCLKGAQADLSKELHLQGKLEKRKEHPSQGESSQQPGKQ